MKHGSQLYAYAEEVLCEDYLLATYFTEAPSGDDIYKRAEALAVGQTIGTWTPVPGITDEMRAKYMARVVAAYDVPPTELTGDLPSGKRAFILQIAFPVANFGASLPMILTTLLGNDVSTSIQLKLLDIQIPASLAKAFGGPKFGIEGIRERAQVPKRALLLNVMKPCTGFPSEAAVPWFEESARGGTDIIKDDELLGSPSYNHVLKRVTLFRQAAQRVFEETGHRTLYCANVTDRADTTLENARRAVELGADMVMINLFSGLGVVQAVAADPNIDVPVLVHYAGFATMTEAQRSGLSSPLLLGKLVRLAGADAISFTSPYSSYPLLLEKFIRTAELMSMPLYDVKRSLPVAGGGIHPATAVQLVHDLGNDIMLTVGGAIQGHPGGGAAGARAMLAALQAAEDGTPVEQKAREVPELAVALEKWHA